VRDDRAAFAPLVLIGCQFHPEFTSTPRAGILSLRAFVEAALQYQASKTKTAIAA